MKTYEEIAKNVIERSREIRAKKIKRNRIIRVTAGFTAFCAVIAGTIGFVSLQNRQQGANIVLTSGSDLPYYTEGNTDLTEHTSPTEPNTEIDPKNTDPANAYCPVHTDRNTSVYLKNGYDYGYAPEKNTVYVSEVLSECINSSSEQFDDGCYQVYQVCIIYFKDGKALKDMGEELFDSEYNRLSPFIFEKYDKSRCLTGIIKVVGENEKSAISIEALMTKSQIESFPASEDYGIALYLAGNYWTEESGEHHIEDPDYADLFSRQFR